MAQLDVYPIPSCAECGIQSAGKCPACHQNLCVDHFPLDAHAPCAARLAASETKRKCYICGEPRDRSSGLQRSMRIILILMRARAATGRFVTTRTPSTARRTSLFVVMACVATATTSPSGIVQCARDCGSLAD